MEDRETIMHYIIKQNGLVFLGFDRESDDIFIFPLSRWVDAERIYQGYPPFEARSKLVARIVISRIKRFSRKHLLRSVKQHKKDSSDSFSREKLMKCFQNRNNKNMKYERIN